MRCARAPHLPPVPAHGGIDGALAGLLLPGPPVDSLRMPAHPPASADEPRNRGPIRVYRLGAEPGDDLSATSTPEERVALVWELSQRLWALTGQPAPAGSRDRLPIRVIRPA